MDAKLSRHLHSFMNTKTHEAEMLCQGDGILVYKSAVQAPTQQQEPHLLEEPSCIPSRSAHPWHRHKPFTQPVSISALTCLYCTTR